MGWTWRTGNSEGAACVRHVLVIIFLEFFSVGLTIAGVHGTEVFYETFQAHSDFTYSYGIIYGIKGLFTFLCAPIIGALSDIWGRKLFLVLSVAFTCCPIPFIFVHAGLYFTLVIISGMFTGTTFLAFAYVSDVKCAAVQKNDKCLCCSVNIFGLVCATITASLASSSFLSGAFEGLTAVTIATGMTLLNILYIIGVVPESLPSTNDTRTAWEKLRPFSAIGNILKQKTIILISIIVFFSGVALCCPYPMMFAYIRLATYTSPEETALLNLFIAMVTFVAQSGILTFLVGKVGLKKTILIGVFLQVIQLGILMCFAVLPRFWLAVIMSLLLGLLSLTVPSIGAIVSSTADSAKQGVAQGVIAGIVGLSSGLWPILFTFLFKVFPRYSDSDVKYGENGPNLNGTLENDIPDDRVYPGPPFAIAALLVLVAFFVTFFIPEQNVTRNRRSQPDQVLYKPDSATADPENLLNSE